MAVWGSGTEGILGVIEVKLGAWFTFANVGVDVRRPTDALVQAPDLQWAMAAFHFACWTEVAKTGAERLRERTDRVVRRAREHAADRGQLTCTEFVDDPCRWGIGTGFAGAVPEGPFWSSSDSEGNCSP